MLTLLRILVNVINHENFLHQVMYLTNSQCEEHQKLSARYVVQSLSDRVLTTSRDSEIETYIYLLHV